MLSNRDGWSWKKTRYLFSFVMNRPSSSCDNDCQVRIGKDNSVSRRLKPIWKNKWISLALSMRLCESLDLSTMLYCAEHERKLENSAPDISATDIRRHFERERSKRGSQGEDLLSRTETDLGTSQEWMIVLVITLHCSCIMMWHCATFVARCRYECLQVDMSLLKCGVMMTSVSWTPLSTRSVKIALTLKVSVETTTAMVRTISLKQDYHIPLIHRNRSSLLNIFCKTFSCFRLPTTIC